VKRIRVSAWIEVTSLAVALSLYVPAQTNCDAGAGPLRPVQPSGIAVSEIIKRFSALEDQFKEAQTHFTYSMEVTVQTLQGEDVDGEFRRLSEISHVDGKRTEHVTFAPQSTLRRISLSKQDFDDLDNRSPFVLTTEELPQYNLLYVGQQKVDMLETYVFEVAPKVLEKRKRYFQGKVWVETRDLAIVKSCGKRVPDDPSQQNNKKKKTRPGGEEVTPTMVTYREQFEEKYWFPTYIRADETLHFLYGDSTHVREVIKYTKYKRADADSRTASKIRP
jgi:hypothetical protein